MRNWCVSARPAQGQTAHRDEHLCPAPGRPAPVSSWAQDSPAAVLLSWKASPLLCQYPTDPPRPRAAHGIPYQLRSTLAILLWLLGPVVDPGRVLVCTLPFTVLSLSLRPSSFSPEFTITLSPCPVPGTCGHQSWLGPRAELSSQGHGLVQKVTAWVDSQPYGGAQSGGRRGGVPLTSMGPASAAPSVWLECEGRGAFGGSLFYVM